MVEFPTGEQFAISSGGYEAVIVEGGGGLRSLSFEGVPLVASYDVGEVVPAGSGQVLMPWPNRLRDGAYSFDGSDYQLALSEPARHNASHGLVRWSSWRPESWERESVTMRYRLVGQSGYPWPMDLSAAYRLSSAGLGVTLSATNLGAATAPFACGMHPYLDVGCPVDQAVLTLPGTQHQLVDDRMLPTRIVPAEGDYDFRAEREIGSLTLDDAYTELLRGDQGRCVVRLEGAHAVELWIDDSWPWVQVFTGDGLPRNARRALAVEPMTSPADAFNSGRDLVVLPPGGTWTATYGINHAPS